MALLVDLFGYLSIVLHGLTIVMQSMALGSVLFLVVLVRPLRGRIVDWAVISRRTTRLAAWSALALIACEAVTIAMQSAVLMETVELPLSSVIGAEFVVAGLIKIGAASVLAISLFAGGGASALMLVASAIVLIAATQTTHAAARLDHRDLLLAVSFLHQLGAAIWIGGIPAFVTALGRSNDRAGWREIGVRFSRMSMVGVACIVVSAAVMCVLYVGDWRAAYGTAYGVMIGAKLAMFGALLLLGLGNLIVTERLRRNREAPVLRLRRFAEVEIGIGFTIFFAAASLTSVPPAIDLTADRVTWPEIVDRNTPQMPRLSSPDHDRLGIPDLQARLDVEAARQSRSAPPAFVPGSGELPPRNADDIAWSEYNHHWAGIFVLAIGLFSVLGQAGLRWARHWPLVFVALALFLLIRSDPEVWPLGQIGFFESFRDVEVLQHRVFVVVIIGFGVFEWAVRIGRLKQGWAPLVFPIATALGGALLLTHSHAIANVKDQLLIELTHTPLALAGVAAGWSRWLELRVDGRAARISGWVWPMCFLFVGMLLLLYREA